MLTLYLTVPTRALLGDFDTLVEALACCREHWMEEPTGPLVFTVEDGVAPLPLAILARHPDDAELCCTSYSDGRVELHRCRYLLDAGGAYLRTEVVELTDVTGAPAPAADLVVPVPFPCVVCGKSRGWDTPSGVCSAACHAKAQGFPDPRPGTDGRA